MKCLNVNFGVLLFTVVFSSGIAQSQWKLIGLDSQAITALAVDDANNVIAGSKSSLSLCFQNKWYVISSVGLQVENILVTGPNRIVLALGKGSKSDGLYQGDSNLNGPPFYSVKLVDWMTKPTALAKTENSDVVFVANGRSVAKCYLDTAGSGYFGLTAIKIPEYSFGVEMPFCGALHYGSSMKRLFAGGYDKSPMPGPGNLLWGDSDSLKKIRTMSISAMAEGVIDLGEGKFFIGTIDSGIYYRSNNMSMLVQKYSESPNNETINDILVMPKKIHNGFLCVAVPSGVYVRTDDGDEWVDIGNIPVEPLCLAYTKTEKADFILYAGTKKGVYAINSSAVSIKSKYLSQVEYNYSALYDNSNKTIAVSFKLPRSEFIDISILDLSGRTIDVIKKNRFETGKYSRIFKIVDKGVALSNGVYFIRTNIGYRRMVNRVVFVK